MVYVLQKIPIFDGIVPTEAEGDFISEGKFYHNLH